MLPLDNRAEPKIEITLRGVLPAGKWRDASDLDRITEDNKRNTLSPYFTAMIMTLKRSLLKWDIPKACLYAHFYASG